MLSYRISDLLIIFVVLGIKPGSIYNQDRNVLLVEHNFGHIFYVLFDKKYSKHKIRMLYLKCVAQMFHNSFFCKRH